MSPSKPKADKPPKPWSRAEAGRYVSSDGRFTLESDGAGRWFATDAESLDELGLARTIGPFPTLDAAKAGADEAREAPAATSPLAQRLKAGKGSGAKASNASGTSSKAETKPEPEPEPEPPPRTWLDDLSDKDGDLAKRARKLVAALEKDGIDDADTLVRRDVLGDRPAVATRILAREVLKAIGRLKDPSAEDLAVAVADVLAGSTKRGGLPGWELRERDAPAGRDRPIRLTANDLEDAAGH